MIVVDSSAVVTILLREPPAAAVAAALAQAQTREMSCANYVETGMVLARRDPRRRNEVLADLRAFIARAGIALTSLDRQQADVALAARVRFGKGFGHRAGLNYGDSFAYALAKVRDAPLLFIGDDFIHTDITSALATV